MIDDTPIRDGLLAKARESARAEGRDIEVTSVALGMACARIAELEGARAKASDMSVVEEVRGILLRNQDTPEPRLAEVIVAAVSERQASVIAAQAKRIAELEGKP